MGIELQSLDRWGGIQGLLGSKKARNKLTHPRTVYDIEVTDYDMHCHTVAGMWVQREFQGLFNERVNSLLSGLSEGEQAALSNRTKENHA